MARTLLLYILILFSVGCQNVEKPEAGSQQPKAFFSLKDFINKEISQLSETQPPVAKRIELQGRSEEKMLDSLNYEKELDVFSRSDINKVAWLDKYKADSTFQNGKLVQVAYKSLDEGLKTQLLEVNYQDGSVSSIFVRNSTRSIVANVEQELHYWPGKGYSMATEQSTTFSRNKKVKVEVEYR